MVRAEPLNRLATSGATVKEAAKGLPLFLGVVALCCLAPPPDAVGDGFGRLPVVSSPFHKPKILNI